MNEVSQPPGRGRIVVAWLALATSLFLCALWPLWAFARMLLFAHGPYWPYGLYPFSLLVFFTALWASVRWVEKVCAPVSREIFSPSLYGRLRRFAAYGFKRVFLRLFLPLLVLSLVFGLAGYLPDLQAFTKPLSMILGVLAVLSLWLHGLSKALTGSKTSGPGSKARQVS